MHRSVAVFAQLYSYSSECYTTACVGSVDPIRVNTLCGVEQMSADPVPTGKYGHTRQLMPCFEHFLRRVLQLTRRSCASENCSGRFAGGLAQLILALPPNLQVGELVDDCLSHAYC